MEEVRDHRYSTQEWTPNKDHSKSRKYNSLQVQEPRRTSNQLKAPVANAKVHVSTIRRTLNSSGERGRAVRRTPLFS